MNYTKLEKNELGIDLPTTEINHATSNPIIEVKALSFHEQD